MRLTQAVREQLMQQNEGFTTRTLFTGNNITEERQYEISGGQLLIRSVGKTSWADSRFDEVTVASDEQTHRFLRDNLYQLNTFGIE